MPDTPTPAQTIAALRGEIDRALADNARFKRAAEKFLQTCRRAIRDDITIDDARELLVQHILTRDVLDEVFGDAIMRENQLAAGLRRLLKLLPAARNIDAPLWQNMPRTAGIAAREQKQQKLKTRCEEFYKTRNRNDSVRLGVVYTPGEIVRFMLAAVDHALRKHLKCKLQDRRVQIIDPATGTGTFIAELIDYLPRRALPRKYAREMHANEVNLLAYHIAALNIEAAYRQKTGEYQPFANLHLADTLLQPHPPADETAVNVVIGNPPYNDRRKTWHDDKNPAYRDVDARIKETYIARGRAQRTHQYDMYKRFIRWGADRIGARGVLAFVSNRAWLDANQDAGFRNAAMAEFDEIYALDLGGNLRANRHVGNVFGIMTGVAIGLFVRDGRKRHPALRYRALRDEQSAADKLAWLANNRFADLRFRRIVADQDANWLKQTDNDFARCMPLVSRASKSPRATDANAAFKLYAPGIMTARDDWVYDFSRENLRAKSRFFIRSYNAYANADAPPAIKWSDSLQLLRQKGRRIKLRDERIVRGVVRPFVRQYYNAHPMLNDRLTRNHHWMFGADLTRNNRVICFTAPGALHPFHAVAVDLPPNSVMVGATQCLPLYRYDAQDKRRDNLSEYGRRIFREKYGDVATPRNIFDYVYAVLHNPNYRETYAVNLHRELPRVPLYDDFTRWASWGARLMRLHMHYEKVKPYPLRREDEGPARGRPRLKLDAARAMIIVDSRTVLHDVPAAAWQYRLGAHSAVEWVLRRHREKPPRPSANMPRELVNYRFAERKEETVELIGKVCAVSVETLAIMQEMRSDFPGVRK